MTDNAFAVYGEQVAPTRVPRTRKQRNLREVQKEASQISKAARLADRKRLGDVLRGPWGPAMTRLRQLLRVLGPTDAAMLIGDLQANIELRIAPADVRWLALQMIDRAIVRTRKRAGLMSFDDGFPDEPARAFGIIKQMLGVR